MWPNAKISVMGGEQAASVLSTIQRDNREAAGKTWSTAEEEAFKSPIREQYARQGSAYYSTARLWDDGIIEPQSSRQVCLAISNTFETQLSPQVCCIVFGCNMAIFALWVSTIMLMLLLLVFVWRDE